MVPVQPNGPVKFIYTVVVPALMALLTIVASASLLELREAKKEVSDIGAHVSIVATKVTEMSTRLDRRDIAVDRRLERLENYMQPRRRGNNAPR